MYLEHLITSNWSIMRHVIYAYGTKTGNWIPWTSFHVSPWNWLQTFLRIVFLILSFMNVVNIPFLFVPQYQIAVGTAHILLKNLFGPMRASQSLHWICLHSTYGSQSSFSQNCLVLWPSRLMSGSCKPSERSVPYCSLEDSNDNIFSMEWLFHGETWALEHILRSDLSSSFPTLSICVQT